MDSSCDCNCVQWTVSNAEVKSQTCPEKSHNSWWAFEGTKENSDSAIFSHVSDCFTPFEGTSVDVGDAIAERAYHFQSGLHTTPYSCAPS